MVRPSQARRLIDMVVVDAAGDWVGTVCEVFLDRQTGEPAWATVRLGWFGPGVFVPLIGLDITGIRIRAPYDKATITSAPRHDALAPLTPADEHALNTYYGLPAVDPPAPGVPTNTGSEGRSAPTVPPGRDIAVVLHAECTNGTEILAVERVPVGTSTVNGPEIADRNLPDDGGDAVDGDTFGRSVN